MTTSIVRAIPRATVRPNASSIQPRLNIAARPHTAPGMFGVALRRAVLALRILRPVECQSTTNQPVPEIDAVNQTRCDGPPVLIQRDRGARDWALGDEGVEIVR